MHQGDVLFEIDPQPFIAALGQAQAGLAQAHAAQAQAIRDLARARPLSQIDAVSERELDAAVAANDSASAQVKAAEAAVQTAQLNLGYTKVRSPIAGTMSRALIRLGGVVTAYTTLLTTVYQTDPMWANFSVGEQRMLQIQRELGRPMNQGNPSERQFRLLLADGSEYNVPAKLNFVDAAVDTRTDTLALRLTVPNPDGLLKAGQYVRVQVATAEQPNTLLVPQRAVQVLQDKNFVWIVDKAGKAQMRDVHMGPQQGNYWIVEQGLAPGDVVIVDGTQKLKPDLPVKAQPLPETDSEPRAS
jgi:membrane fusion protein (multidrug efflux system)